MPTILNLFRMVYVFNPQEPSGWEHKAPKFVAMLLCKRDQRWSGLDYWYTPEGM